MKRGVSLSFRRPGQPVPRTAAGTINKGMTYMQIAASRKRAQSYVPGIVAYAKAEAGLPMTTETSLFARQQVQARQQPQSGTADGHRATSPLPGALVVGLNVLIF